MLQTLDVIISVLFIFLMFSLLISAAQEVLAAMLRLRSKTLKSGWNVILQNLDSNNLVKDFWNHPFIKSVQASDSPPAYIPSSNVAAALLHIAAGNKTGKAVDMTSLKARIGDLSPSGMTTIIATVIEQVGASATLAQVQAGLEAWVDQAMERVSSLYQRQTRVWLFLISLGTAAVMNVDVAIIWQRVSMDKVLRDSLVAQAAKVQLPTTPGEKQPNAPKAGAEASTDKVPRDSLVAQAAKVELPTTPVEKQPNAPKAGAASETSPVPKTPADLEQAANQYRKSLETFNNLGLPIGWTNEALAQYSGFWAFVLHVLAIVASAFAASLGAPFWFDLLKRFMNIRSVIKPITPDGINPVGAKG